MTTATTASRKTKACVPAVVTRDPVPSIRGEGQVAGLLHVSGDATRVVLGNPLRIVLYGARSVCGLISNDRNGIAILHNGYLSVVTTEMGPYSIGGQHGPSQAQVSYFKELLEMPEDELMDTINNSENLRTPLRAN